MTWATTHLAVESLIVFLLLPSEKKKYYSRNRRKWMIISLLAELPDLDTFTRVHRSFSHSFVVAIVVSLILYLSLRRMKIIQENPSLMTAITYLPIFWIVHILFDLGFGPLQLFYPLTDSFYLVSFSLLFSLKPLGPIPFLLTGIKIDIKVLTPSAGVRSFISNLSYEERLAIFGTSNISYPIDDFPLHATLFIGWLLWASSPWLRTKIGFIVQTVGFSKSGTTLQQIIKWTRTTPEGVLSIGFSFLTFLLLITASLVPASQPVSIVTSWDLKMLTEQATLMQGREIILPEVMNVSTKLYFPASITNITIGYTLLDQFPNELEKSINNLLKNWTGVFATPDFKKFYQASLQNLSSLLPELTSITLRNQTQIVSFTLQNVQQFSVLFLLLDWNASSSFIKQGTLQITGTHYFPEKKKELFTGSFFASIGPLALVLIYSVRARKWLVFDQQREQ